MTQVMKVGKQGPSLQFFLTGHAFAAKIGVRKQSHENFNVEKKDFPLENHSS